MPIQRDVRSRIRRLLARSLALTMVASGSVLLVPGPVGAYPSTGSVAAIYSGYNDGGLSESFVARPGGYERFDVTGTAESGLALVLQSPSDYRRTYRLQFAAPAGEALQAGTYTDARPLFNRAAGQPGFQVQDQYGCPASVGRFEVLEMAADLSRFWILFEYRCTPGSQATFGEIRYSMPMDSDLEGSATRIAFPAATFDEGVRSVNVDLRNRSLSTIRAQGYSITGPGAVAFRGSGTCAEITPGSWCRITVTYNPLVTTPQEAKLTVNTNAAVGSYTVDLSGPGLSADDPVFARSVGVPPDPTSYVQMAPYQDTIALTWNNPRNVDFVDTVVRMAAGTAPPASPEDGAQVYAGPAERFDVTDLDTGTPYSFALFARDAEGRFAEPAVLTVGGALITVRPDRTGVTYGDDVILSGRLTDAITGAGIPVVTVYVLGYDKTTGKYASGGTTKTYASGDYQIGYKPKQNYEYVVFWDGDYNHTGAIGFSRLVTVSMGVQIRPVDKFVPEGSPLELIIGVYPVHAGQKVVIERQIKGKWKKYKTFKVRKKSPFKVSIKAPEGNYNFRATLAPDARHTKGTSNRVNMQVIGKADP